jgi:hypothetical protein
MKEPEFKFIMDHHITWKTGSESHYIDKEKGVTNLIEYRKSKQYPQWVIIETKKCYTDFDSFLKAYKETAGYKRSLMKINN